MLTELAHNESWAPSTSTYIKRTSGSGVSARKLHRLSGGTLNLAAKFHPFSGQILLPQYIKSDVWSLLTNL